MTPPYFKQRLVPFGEYVPLAGLLRRIRPISRAVPSAFTPGAGATLLPARDLEARRRRVLRGRLPLDRARGDARGGRRPLHAHERRVVRPRGRAAAALAVGRRARDRDGPSARARGDHRNQRSRGRNGRVLVTLGPDSKGAFAVPLERPSAPPPAAAAGDAAAWVCAAGLGGRYSPRAASRAPRARGGRLTRIPTRTLRRREEVPRERRTH